MQIIVKLLSGKKANIDIEPSDTIKRIKERVEEKALLFIVHYVFEVVNGQEATRSAEGIPPPQQRLIFGGKAMADDKTADDYALKAGAIIHLVLALRGGL